MTAARDHRPIVVADDDEDDLFFARRALRTAAIGGEILSCRDGKQVVALLSGAKAGSSEVPLAVFLDVKMPHLDGFQTLKWIRAQPRFSNVGVFMLSGSAETRDIELALSLGANDYLIKYPSPEAIARAVDTLIL